MQRRAALAALVATVAVGGVSCTPAGTNSGTSDVTTSAAAGTDAAGLTAAQRAAGWRPLFNGTSTAGWRGYRSQTVPAGWRVEGGTLTKDGPIGDLITTNQ